MTARAPFVCEASHAAAHVRRHANGALRVVGQRQRIVEHAEQAVPDEPFQGAIILRDQLAGVVLAKTTSLRRGWSRPVCRVIREGRKDDGYVAPMTFQMLFFLHWATL